MSLTEDTSQEALEGAETTNTPIVETPAEPKSSLDVVIGVLDKAKEDSPASPAGDVKAKTEEAANPEEDGKPPEERDLSDAEMKQLSARTQSRIRYLSRQSKEAQSKLEEAAPKVAVYDQLVDFTRRNNLAKEEINNALTIAALIKSDPIQAFRHIETIYKNLSGQVGAQLPEDLAERVRTGYISEADAKEQARLRAENTIIMRQREDESKRVQQETQAAAHQMKVNVAVSEADRWVADKAKTDPDWEIKQRRVSDLVKLRLLETGKFPESGKEVVAMCNDALAQVEKEISPLLQNKRPMNPVTSTVSSPRTATPSPKNSLEVINNVLAGMAS